MKNNITFSPLHPIITTFRICAAFNQRVKLKFLNMIRLLLTKNFANNLRVRHSNLVYDKRYFGFVFIMQPTLVLVLKVFYTFCLRQLISKFLLTCESYNLPKLLSLVMFHRTLYYCRRYSRRDSDTHCGHGAARVEHPCAPAVQSRSPTQPLHGAWPRGAGGGGLS